MCPGNLLEICKAGFVDDIRHPVTHAVLMYKNTESEAHCIWMISCEIFGTVRLWDRKQCCYRLQVSQVQVSKFTTLQV